MQYPYFMDIISRMSKLFDTSKAIIDELGRDLVREHMKCTPTALSNHYVSGKFPSSWWYELKKLSESRGIEISEAAFNWKEVRGAQDDHHAA